MLQVQTAHTPAKRTPDRDHFTGSTGGHLHAGQFGGLGPGRSVAHVRGM